ncbi:hypothetical protein GCM10027317_17730 [Massilia agri]
MGGSGKAGGQQQGCRIAQNRLQLGLLEKLKDRAFASANGPVLRTVEHASRDYALRVALSVRRLTNG